MIGKCAHIVEAIQFDGTNIDEVDEFVYVHWGCSIDYYEEEEGYLRVGNRAGDRKVYVDQWLLSDGECVFDDVFRDFYSQGADKDEYLRVIDAVQFDGQNAEEVAEFAASLMSAHLEWHDEETMCLMLKGAKKCIHTGDWIVDASDEVSCSCRVFSAEDFEEQFTPLEEAVQSA